MDVTRLLNVVYVPESRRPAFYRGQSAWRLFRARAAYALRANALPWWGADTRIARARIEILRIAAAGTGNKSELVITLGKTISFRVGEYSST